MGQRKFHKIPQFQEILPHSIKLQLQLLFNILNFSESPKILNYSMFQGISQNLGKNIFCQQKCETISNGLQNYPKFLYIVDQQIEFSKTPKNFLKQLAIHYLGDFLKFRSMNNNYHFLGIFFQLSTTLIKKSAPG